MKEGWEIKTLGEVCDILDRLRKPITKSDRVVGDYPYYGATGILSYVDHYIFSEDLVLLGEDGAKWGVGERSAFIATGKYWVNNHAHVLKPKNDALEYNWLVHYLNGNDLTPFVTGMTVPKLTQEKMRSIPIPLPPLTEQQRIVSIIDEAFEAIDKAIENTQKNLQNAKELLDSYLHKFYTSTFEGWEEKKLKDIAEYFNGLTYSPKDVSNVGIIVLRSSNVQNDELDFNDIIRVNLEVKEKIKVKEGDVLMCSRNGSARLVGKTATIKNLSEVMTFGTFMMIVRSPYNPYLAWFFKSEEFRNQIKGGENTMINQITRYMLDDIYLSFPPVHKQIEIVEKLDTLSFNLNNVQTVYQQKLLDLEELKKSILNKAFAGEL